MKRSRAAQVSFQQSVNDHNPGAPADGCLAARIGTHRHCFDQTKDENVASRANCILHFNTTVSEDRDVHAETIQVIDKKTYRRRMRYGAENTLNRKILTKNYPPVSRAQISPTDTYRSD